MMQHYIRMSSFKQGRGMSAFVFLLSETILLFYELQKKQALLSLLNDSEEQAQRWAEYTKEKKQKQQKHRKQTRAVPRITDCLGWERSLVVISSNQWECWAERCAVAELCIPSRSIMAFPDSSVDFPNPSKWNDHFSAPRHREVLLPFSPFRHHPLKHPNVLKHRNVMFSTQNYFSCTSKDTEC